MFRNIHELRSQMELWWHPDVDDLNFTLPVGLGTLRRYSMMNTVEKPNILEWPR